ncbi:unnamed protein product [Psylliodes chrysocephalus]|uniref:Uncharacterized protein n=1 Tax=Psylliodes chrysocephalus TaxID=3402493 RepID=A0A9P0D9C6_9CUCU|nr:unnamed protein product [Psylliodes chrysocephala]
MACCPPNCSPCCAGPPSVPFCPPPCSPCYAGPNFMPPCAPCWTGASQATWMPTCYPINASCFCCPPAPPPKPKCGPNGPRWPDLTEDQEYILRFSNFYNNYNKDYHTISPCSKPPKCVPGMGVCGPPRYCTDVKRKKNRPLAEEAGCPTGFKPCYMKMFPPADNHPCGVWCAEVQLCPQKPRQPKFYNPGPCKRPCCKHRPSSGRCIYDLPCKAACFRHVPGIHPCNPWLD